jgi:hypothetical protein
LVFLRDELLRPFGDIYSVTCDIANVTVHPIYFANPHLPNPLGELGEIKKSDSQFWEKVVDEANDLLNGGTANANFQSAQRVARFAIANINPKKLKELKAYLQANATRRARARRWEEEDE